MAVVRPLRGLRFDPARVGDLGAVIAPPYDVISAAEQGALYARSPYNVVRLILPREAPRATAAARTLGEWIGSGVLIGDPAPSIYLYAQSFTLADGSRHCRQGIICRLGLEDFARGVVLPHEHTLPGPKADRLAILRATGAYLSPIFGLYARGAERPADLVGLPATAAPIVDVRDAGGDEHRLWRITDAEAIARVTEALAPEQVIIADGHHRYETGLAYRDERGGTGRAASILACLANMEGEGIVILPTHRLVRGTLRLAPCDLERRLADCFSIEVLDGPPRLPAGAIDCLLPGRRLRLRAKAAASAHLERLAAPIRGLDVTLLHQLILEPILGLDGERLDFTHDTAEAEAAVARGAAGAAFLLNPPTIAEIQAVCRAGELMPQKSTYFHPKLATGLVLDLVGPPWV
jgi:uncharacterized protein (DUF1015 family)